jgi:ABC-type transport system involved in cytochrome bd biosynthesis fused ATPase/permease subunit
MLKPWQFNLLTALGAIALLLALTNAVFFTRNRAAQAEVNNRQQFVQQSAALEGLYRDIVKALAELAVKNNDTQLMQMLSAQGINVSVNPPAPAPAAPAAPAPAAPKR